MISENILKIRKVIGQTCSAINKDPALVTIVAVSKGRSLQQIEEVVQLGMTDIGENRVQEAVSKFNQLSQEEVKWHMVGHLQTNKAKDAVKIFDLIHSIDTLHLGQEIDRQAARIGKTQDILIEVKTSPEATKFGVKPEEAIVLIEETAKLKNINIKGLMTIAPLVKSPEEARPYFRALRELKEKIQQSGILDFGFGILSMGMTDDYLVAIEEGSNMLRLGRAVFEG